ncbi:glycoside hydrolase, partial [Listeria monocytogenes]
KEVLENKQENYIFPLFWISGEEDEYLLREYMGKIYETGIRAVCVESRIHTDFMGEKWWRDMDVIMDEARKRRMKVWVIDDVHFPTGSANGK